MGLKFKKRKPLEKTIVGNTLKNFGLLNQKKEKQSKFEKKIINLNKGRYERNE